MRDKTSGKAVGVLLRAWDECKAVGEVLSHTGLGMSGEKLVPSVLWQVQGGKHHGSQLLVGAYKGHLEMRTENRAVTTKSGKQKWSRQEKGRNQVERAPWIIHDSGMKTCVILRTHSEELKNLPPSYLKFPDCLTATFSLFLEHTFLATFHTEVYLAYLFLSGFIWKQCGLDHRAGYRHPF